MSDVVHLQSWPGRPACGARSPSRPKPWPHKRRPVCNRMLGHDGPHQEVDRRSFDVLHQWAPSAFPIPPALALSPRLSVLAAGDRMATEVERFGLGAFLLATGGTITGAGLIVPDGHPRADDLAAWCRARRVATPAGSLAWQCVTLAEFCELRRGILAHHTYSRTGWLVSADLGRVLGLLSGEWTPARGAFRQGFTLYPAGWEKWRKAEDGRLSLGSASRHRPPLRVLAQTAVGYKVEWARPPGGEKAGKRAPDGSGHWRGRFFDVVAQAVPLDAVESSDLADHAEAWGLGRVTLPAAVPVDEDGAEQLAETLDVVDRLGLLLDQEGRRWLTTAQDRREMTGRLDLRFLPTAGTLAARIEEASGAPPMMQRPGAPDDAAMGRWMGAHHGGWLSAELAGAGLFPAIDVDIHSAYPAMHALLDLQSLRDAERYDTENVMAPLRALLRRLAGGDVSSLFERATWERFGATVCEIVPCGEEWPVQAPDDDYPEGHAVLRETTFTGAAASTTLSFAWPDVALAALRARRVPEVVSATRLVGIGLHPSIRKRRPLFDGTWVGPGEDVGVALVRIRDDAKARGDLRLAATLRVVVNSLSYGITAQINQDDVRRGRRWTVGEKAVRNTFPPIGSSVTAACRLAVGVAEHLVEKAGGTVASRDTDGLLLVASPDGGPVILDDGRVVGAISWPALDEIMARFDGLDPFGTGASFFKAALREHRGRPLHGLVLRIKRYAIGTLDDRGNLGELVEATEHGLGGQVIDPPGADGRAADGRHLWTRDVAAEAMAQAAARRRRKRARPVVGRWPWERGVERFPQLQRMQTASPGDLAYVEERYCLRLRPFGHYVQASMGLLKPLAALDPGDDLAGWSGLAWHDPYGGMPDMTTDPDADLDDDATAWVLPTVGDKALDWMEPYLLPPRPVTIDDPRCIRPVGKSGKLLEARAAGDDETPTEDLRADYGSPAELAAVIVEQARRLGPVSFAETYDVPFETVKSWTAGRKTPSAGSVRKLSPRLGRDPARECLCGCGTALPANRPKYHDDTHRERAKKRRSRSRRDAAVPPSSHGPGGTRVRQRERGDLMSTVRFPAGLPGGRRRGVRGGGCAGTVPSADGAADRYRQDGGLRRTAPAPPGGTAGRCLVSG
ncbi:MAG: hypothetical protein ACYCU7_18345 [Acidimicrobiales bacterium]